MARTLLNVSCLSRGASVVRRYSWSHLCRLWVCGVLCCGLACKSSSPAGDASARVDADVDAGTDDANADSSLPDAGEALSPGHVRISRDDAGIPHIEGADLASALYGLGWVQAEDRLFQMFYRRARVRGELAESFAVEDPNAEESEFNAELVAKDIKARTLSLGRTLDGIVSRMPREHVALLEAFARGVNDQIASRESLGVAFDNAGIRDVRPWTTSDALTGWESIGSIFGNSLSAANREIAQMAQCASGSCEATGCSRNYVNDDAAAVPPPSDGIWPPETATRTASFRQAGEMRGPVDVKASQGFVVAGRHLTSGAPLIFGEPQVLLEAPSIWYEHHIVVPSESIDVRGVGLAGSPGMLLFFGRYVWHLEGPAAWFATAAFAIAILGTVVSARYIDVSEFVGVRQLLRRRSRQRAAPPELSVRGPYAYCRHPQYVLMIIVFWTGPVMTWSRFELAAIATLYFLVGVILEERNLRAELGPSYDEYSANVPMWIPRLTPWYPPQHAAAAESV